MPYIAFTSRPERLQVPGRLIVRRVKRLSETTHGQGELFDVYRHHAVFTTSPHTMLQAEAQHRGHAVIEQVIADAKASALAHLPSASFQANAAWATLWAIAHRVARATGVLASPFHARATTTTIGAHLINVPARLARTARRLKLHLPQHWPWQNALDTSTQPSTADHHEQPDPHPPAPTVEDEYSGVPRDPNPGLKFDGRMYPPREDFTERTADGGIRATTRGNQIEISPDGTTSILSRKTGEEVYRRPGANLVAQNALNPELRKIQALAATDYPAGLESPTATIPEAQSAPPAVHRKPERDDRTPGR